LVLRIVMGEPEIGFVPGCDCTNLRFFLCMVMGEREIGIVSGDWTSLRLVSCHTTPMKFLFSVIVE